MKTFIAFMAGAVIGAIAAYIYTDKKKAAEFEEELEACKKHYEQKSQCKCDGDCSCKKAESETETVDIEEDIPQEVIEKVAEMQKTIRKNKVAYNKIIEEKGYDTMSTEKKPYLISADDFFGNRYNDYSRVEYYFNPEDCELFDEDGEFVEDADETVGIANLSALIERVETEVYICNPELEILYNVCIEEA